jgi:cell shape-determining protein MreC
MKEMPWKRTLFFNNEPHKMKKWRIMRSISYRMLFGIIILIVILLVIIIFVAGALLMSTGNAPQGEISGIYGMVLAIESYLAGIIENLAGWIDYLAQQIQQLAGNL